MTEPADIRWEQRLANFSRAIALLREVVEGGRPVADLSDLEKEGSITRFVFTFELAWKTLKDKMTFDGLEPDLISPKPVLRAAYQAKYLDEIEPWIAMVNDRNLIAHKYDFSTFDRILADVASTYYPLLDGLHLRLIEQKLQS